jgi:hypothetical protein
MKIYTTKLIHLLTIFTQLKNVKKKALAPLHFICLFLFIFFLTKAHQITLTTTD